MIELPIQKVRPEAIVPARAYAGDAGLDLAAIERIELGPGERAVVPTGLAVRRVSATQLNVSFAAVSGAATYLVERKRAGTNRWVTIRTLAGNVTSFSDVNLPANARYSYRVAAAGPGGVSARSSSVSA